MELIVVLHHIILSMFTGILPTLLKDLYVANIFWNYTDFFSLFYFLPWTASAHHGFVICGSYTSLCLPEQKRMPYQENLF